MIAPRVIVVGPPDAGKSTLIAALRAVPGCGPYSLRELDGRSGAAVLAEPDRLRDRNPVAAAMAGADAVILTVPAVADDAELDERFRAFAVFLEAFEAAREYARAVGGMPVFLTLTKCDTLWQPGDDPAAWQAQVAARRQYVRQRFAEFQTEPGAPSAFGTLDVDTAATAMRFPPDSRFDGLAAPFGVEELATATACAADEFRARSVQSRTLLRRTLTATTFLVSILAAGLAVLVAAPDLLETDPLAARVRRLTIEQGPAGMRLGDRTLAANETAWQTVKADPRFDRLPASAKELVENRLAEFAAYRDYRDRFKPPRLGPADVRTIPELDHLDEELETLLAPPADRASAWEQTDAVRLWAKWRADAGLLRSAEATVYEWYRSEAKRATAMQFATAFDGSWPAAVEALAAELPPFRPDDRIPGWSTVSVSGGGALTYAPAFDFDRVAVARQDWEAERDRLLALKDATTAVGRGAFTGADPAAILAALRQQFPNAGPGYAPWAAGTFPGPARELLKRQYRTAFAAGASIVRRKLPADRTAAATALAADPAAADWGELLGLLRRLAGDGTANPVQEAIGFLRRDSFPATLLGVEVLVPDDLRSARAMPAGPFVLTVAGADYRYRVEGEPSRDGPATVIRYVPDDHPGTLTLKPTDAVTAAAPFRANGQDVRLVWDRATSAFDLFTTEPSPRGTGVTLTTRPPDGWPTMPGLLK